MISAALIKHVEIGNWVVGEIADHLIRQFSKAQAHTENKPGLTERCLSHYQKVALPEVVLKSKSLGLQDLEMSANAKYAIDAIFKKELEQAEVRESFLSLEAEKIGAAMTLISNSNPQLYRLILKVVTVFLRADNVHFRSASHPHILGALVFGPKVVDQTVEGIAVSIVHELAHQELYLLNLLDRLVMKEFDYNEIHAPFQGRKRPPIGRLHSLWALYRMIQFERTIGVSIEHHSELLKANCAAFEKSELTDFAKFLVTVTAKQVA